MLPLIMAVAVVLFAQGWRRGALLWLVVVGCTFLATLVLKLMFLSCTPVFGPWHINSPSGHVAAATVVTGGLAVLLTRRKASILPAALMAAIGIGISRLVLHMHSFPEVCIGAGIGMCGAAALIRFAGPPPQLRPMPLFAVVAVVALLFHGMHLPAEAAIRQTAYQAAWFIPACRATEMPMQPDLTAHAPD
ncbi:MAG TPA: phosphatase PAP2 family protein [Rhodopila sp.]|uniref:phosphatase PAP2 family protein n=1 Tax=Rhodopila sp. TaxID=2480087 RepID=UPI002CF4FEDC|nr:phosphatase PAP2 family protein [Rhodopila sp.]HVY17549.1 phosphatase PAP2 family protein [Rhodopila sp.]